MAAAAAAGAVSGPRLEARVTVPRTGFTLDADALFTAPVTALFGPSGSGKTTLLHAVAGLVRPAAGRVVVDGEVLFDAATGVWVPPPRRRVGLVFQDLRLFPHRTVDQNLHYGYRLLPAADRALEPRQLVEVFGLTALLARYPHELSGGERQRVALGRALLAQPRVLLLDEPLAAVDEELRRQILPYLKWAVEQLAVPTVYVSHSLPEILELTEAVCVLQGGRVVGTGEVFEVLERTAHGALGAAFAADSVLTVVVEQVHEDGRWVRGRVGEQAVILPLCALSPGDRQRVAVRPEDVMLSRQRLSGVSARNQLTGEIVRVTGIHGRLLVHVAVGPDAVLRAEITRDAMEELRVGPGDRIYCVVKTSAFRWVLGSGT